MTLAALSAAQMVDLWDRADPDSVAAARLLLQTARPEHLDGDLDGATLGTRDAWLLELRRGTFGEMVKGLVICPECGQRLSLAVETARLLRPPASDSSMVAVDVGDVRVEARVPDGRALRAAAACADVASARLALLEHCIVGAWNAMGPQSPDTLRPEAVAIVGDALAAAEPQAEVRLEVACAACGHEWLAPFDIASFLWAEVSTMAVRLLDEVHVLAAGYGWSEDQILRLSTRRRRHYLERLVSG